jgi:Leucine-rich repeat (LRR) protein
MQDSLQLVSLYNATGGNLWTTKTNWLSSNPINTWFGVQTNAQGCVVRVVLNSNNLIGMLPDLELSNLQQLTLSINQLNGSIPNFTKLPNLSELYLDYNNLTGAIPNFDKLPLLIHLSLYNNRLSGAIPNFDKLPNLRWLPLHNNQLSGPIPNFDKLPNLEKLHLYNNRLSGALPSFQWLTSIRNLYLYNNNLSGCFPSEWQRFCSFRYTSNGADSTYSIIGNPQLAWQGDFQRFCNNEPQIGASCNDSLSYTINDKIQTDCSCRGSLMIDTTTCRYKDSLALAAFYRSTNMQNATPQYKWNLNQPMTTWHGVTLNQNGCVQCIDLDGSPDVCSSWTDTPAGVGLSGTITDSVSLLSNLKTFNVRGNRNLTGQLPPNIGNLTQLKYLFFGKSGLSGAFPNSFWNLPNVSEIDLDDLNLNIPFPAQITNFRKLRGLTACNARLSGSLPTNFVVLDSLHFLNICDNQITGAIPASFTNLRKLQVFQISNNRFDSIPDLSALPFTRNDPSWVNYVAMTHNKLTMDDLLPLKNLINRTPTPFYSYSPQDSIFKDTTITVMVGQNIEVSLGIDGAITDNTYEWFKNGVLTTTNGLLNQNRLILRGVQAGQAGVYTCRVRNPALPNFELLSRKITLVVLPNTSCRYQDSLALIAFYNATGGNNWRKKTNWLSNRPLNEWYGVYTTTEGCVKAIDLDGYNNYNWSVDSFGNNLNGRLPIELGQLSRLEFLSLNSNSNLTGTLPESIGNLQALEILFLNDCRINGPIPDTLWSLPKLNNIDFIKNPINTTLSSKVKNMKKIHGFLLSGAGFTGSIPTEIGQDTTLKSFDACGNRFTGIVPLSIKNLKLHVLSLCENNLDSLPDISTADFRNYGLTYWGTGYLGITNNNFTFDDILPNIRFATVGNGFTFKYAPQAKFYRDTTLYATVGNPLSIDLKIDGAITSNRYVLWKNGVRFRDLGDTIRQNVIYFPNIQLAQAGEYEVRVTNPNAPLLTLISRKITIVVLPNNTCRYRDSIILARDFFPATNGTAWTVRTNPNATSPWNLSRPLDTWHGVILNPEGCVLQLSLENNNLSGTLPSSLDSLKALNYLGLAGNSIGGTMPASIGNLTNLVHLDLSKNQFSGSLPPNLGNLSNLVLMYLGVNPNLTGSIPPSFGNLTKVEELFINECDLTGKIPTELGNMTNLKKLLLSKNRLSDTLPTNLGNLRNLKSLILDNNQLTGKIPASFRNLTGLVCLVFNNNKIDSVPNLSNLAQLDTGCLFCQVNRLTFDDIVTNQRPNAPRFVHTYHPQDSFFVETTLQQAQNTPLSIDLKIDAAMADNVYNWYKNENYGTIWRTLNGSNKLIFNSLQPTDAGVYTVRVTNPKAPNLILQSRKIKVIVLPPTCLSTHATRRDSFCRGTIFTFPDNTTTNTTGSFTKITANTNGCSDTVIYTLNFRQNLKTTRRDSFCSGKTYTFPDGTTTNTIGNFEKRITNANGCTDTILFQLNFRRNLVRTENINLCVGQTYRLPNGRDTAVAGEYISRKSSVGECDSVITTVLSFEDCNALKIYNGLTPDGDDNRYFVVDSLSHFPELQLQVYNLWNELVFRSETPYDNLWNGSDQNGFPLPAGTYYYLLNFGIPNRQPKQGYILLMR